MILGQSYRYLARQDEAGNDVESIAVEDPRVGAGSEKGSFRLKETGQALIPRTIGRGVEWADAKPVLPGTSTQLQIINEKMSKSRGNVINPDDVVREHGADSLRVYEMFMGPLERTKPWQTNGINGVRGFLDKVYNIASRVPSESPMDSETNKLVHRAVKKVGADIEALHFNTAVSTMMILSNHLQSQERPAREALEKLVLCLSPFAPHLAEELWAHLGHTTSIALEPWPNYDAAACEDDEIEVPLQVNGKVRGRVVLRKDADEAGARAAALLDKGVQNQLAGKQIVKTVYVPGRVLNLIVK
jgi:leucyl-tRNA synthetase